MRCAASNAHPPVSGLLATVIAAGAVDTVRGKTQCYPPIGLGCCAAVEAYGAHDVHLLDDIRVHGERAEVEPLRVVDLAVLPLPCAVVPALMHDPLSLAIECLLGPSPPVFH